MKKYFLFLISGMLIMTSIYLLKNGFEIIGMSFYFTITMSIIGFSLGFWVLYKSFILSAQIDIIENDLDGNLIKKSNEEKFKSFFIEGKYEEFKSEAVKNTKVANNKEIFDSIMKNKILKIIDEMNLRDNNDLIFLFSYVQKFILKNKVSNNEMKRQIYLELHIDMPTNAYYGDIINKLFDWKKNESKIKEVKCVYEKSQYFERFIEIKDKFDSLK